MNRLEKNFYQFAPVVVGSLLLLEIVGFAVNGYRWQKLQERADNTQDLRFSADIGIRAAARTYDLREAFIPGYAYISSNARALEAEIKEKELEKRSQQTF